MTANKRKKNTRNQGSNTHGWGRNQHRKAGSRGGVGNAGTGKKCHGNKTRVWQAHLGKSGFVRSRKSNSVSCISIADLEDCLPKWKRQNRVKEEAGVTVVDLTSMGYDRLLGQGKMVTKAKIIVKSAAKRAQEKVTGAGGSLEMKSAKA